MVLKTLIKAEEAFNARKGEETMKLLLKAELQVRKLTHKFIPKELHHLFMLDRLLAKIKAKRKVTSEEIEFAIVMAKKIKFDELRELAEERA